MENIYNPGNFFSTEPQELKEYFHNWTKECCTAKSNTNEEKLRLLREEFDLNLKLDDITKLEERCSIDKLSLSEENAFLPLNFIPQDNLIQHVHPLPETYLETVKSKEEFNKMKDNIDLKTMTISVEEDKDDPSSIKDIEPGSNFIYNVIIYVPFNTMTGTRLTSESLRLQYEIEILGSNTLMELADAIKCVSDHFIIKEVETTTLDLIQHMNAKEKYPSRCFCIENVFYNDMSHPNSIDYSDVVRKWALNRNIANFGSQSMEGVTLDSLKPRLGYGYVYIHQGECEHVLTFSDARLTQKDDCLVSKKYPRLISMKRHSNHLCFMCALNHSSWFVLNSDRLPTKYNLAHTVWLQS
ncbi:hypothetical protein GWI33_021120 [Rhynchophorus ferrugineus]|uniref:snRNA-activating protein complex subunit 3 n=1 Tax=Rhynchophorus ferrugineus TaxID=354439 RepID=A0A834HVA4_RHYFE|nr:hypothetical protein GWI33_021120 [Rhynchophorus ferrugineus]